MIIDGMQQEEGYLVQGGVIYYHGKVFLARASKLKKKILQGAHKEFFLSHMHSTKIYTLIMRSFYWEGLREELHQHFQECMSYVELGKPRNSMQESFQPSLPSFERGEMSMHNSMCMSNLDGKESVHVKQVYFSICTCSFTNCMQAMTPKRSNVSCKSHGNC